MSRGRRRRGAMAAVAVAAAVLGVAAELVAFDESAVRLWMPDLATGWGLVACGLSLWLLTPRSRCGPLLCAAGFAWFAGNFAAAGVPIVAWVGDHAAYVHRAFLAHAVLGFPRGRLASLLRRSVVAAVYVATLWPAAATSDTVWMALALAVLIAGVAVRDRRAAPAAVAFALAVGGVAAARTSLRPVAPEALLHLYEAGIVVTALVLVATARQSVSAVADRVVELGETATVRDALRRVLGDSSLELAFTRDGSYVGERGSPIVPRSHSERRVTALGPSSEMLVIHDPDLGLDGALADAVARALRLTTENARLQADMFDQLAELRASRRRLVLARGRQRARLARRLREGADWRLTEIEKTIVDIDSSDPSVVDSVARARRQLREVREGIAALTLGLQPAVQGYEGLAGALRVLAERLPVPVSLSVDERRVDAAVEHAAYLVCSEALANVAKHAGASRAAVSVAIRDGRVRLEIGDDGRGGADPRGSGLRGLEERVDELGGTFNVASPRGDGTRITASIPLRSDRDLPRGFEVVSGRVTVPDAVGTG